MKKVIAVVGAGACDEATFQAARQVGELLARAGCIVVNGGLGGVMDAASEGANEAGGLVVGILPTADPGDANSFVSVAVATGMGDARNAILANTAQGFVAVAGELGTLSEIAFAVKRGKPVVSLGSWEVCPEVHQAETPKAAVDWILRATG
ncbi:MAG: TIGR00725 family protein [Planctomycetota bacterium]|jgi:uncharacterized protein (TIGR00725 family)